jgi:hypothetical protein
MASKITSALVPLKAQIAPQSVAAAGNATSGWVDAKDAAALLAVANLGTLGGGTVTMSLEQATTSGGAGAKAVTGFTGVASAVDNTQIVSDIEITPALLDGDNSFRFVRMKLANVGGSGALVAGTLQTPNPRFAT